MRACLTRGWLRLYCLEMRGQLIAMHYFYRFGNSVFFMQTGFDPDLASLQPGHVLTGYALEHAIGERSLTFDFLRGQHHYKDNWPPGSDRPSPSPPMGGPPAPWPTAPSISKFRPSRGPLGACSATCG